MGQAPAIPRPACVFRKRLPKSPSGKNWCDSIIIFSGFGDDVFNTKDVDEDANFNDGPHGPPANPLVLGDNESLSLKDECEEESCNFRVGTCIEKCGTPRSVSSSWTLTETEPACPAGTADSTASTVRKTSAEVVLPHAVPQSAPNQKDS